MSRRTLMALVVSVCALALVAVAIATVAPPLHAGGIHGAQLAIAHLHARGLDASSVGLVGVAGMIRQLDPALPYDSLKQRRQAGMGGFRVFPDFLVDTINYPAAGVAAKGFLNFFQGVNAAANDATLSNLPNGALPSPQMFWIQAATVRVIMETTGVDDTVNSSANITRDLDRIATTSRPYFQWSTSSSTVQQGSVPLRALGQMGGVVATFGGNNVPAAAHGWIYHAPRLTTHGGFPMDVVLFPQEQLVVNIQFGVQQAITAQTQIAVELFGWRYLPVGQG